MTNLFNAILLLLTLNLLTFAAFAQAPAPAKTALDQVRRSA